MNQALEYYNKEMRKKWEEMLKIRLYKNGRAGQDRRV